MVVEGRQQCFPFFIVNIMNENDIVTILTELMDENVTNAKKKELLKKINDIMKNKDAVVDKLYKKLEYAEKETEI